MEDIEKQLLTTSGLLIQTYDYDIKATFDGTMGHKVNLTIMKRCMDQFDNHTNFTEEDLDILIQDLNDLSDWRHFKKLNKKINP